MNDLLIGPVEGWRTAEHDIKDDTDAPNIALLCVALPEHLWGHVVWSTVSLVHGVFVIAIVMREAEVNDFDQVVSNVVHDVFRLQVPMSYFLVMAMFDRLQNLLDQKSCICFIKLLSS